MDINKIDLMNWNEKIFFILQDDMEDVSCVFWEYGEWVTFFDIMDAFKKKSRYCNTASNFIVADILLIYYSCEIYLFFRGNSNGHWSDKGCTVDKDDSDSSKSVCECNHLTDFTIIMRPSQVNSKILMLKPNTLFLTFVKTICKWTRLCKTKCFPFTI